MTMSPGATAMQHLCNVKQNSPIHTFFALLRFCASTRMSQQLSGPVDCPYCDSPDAVSSPQPHGYRPITVPPTFPPLPSSSTISSSTQASGFARPTLVLLCIAIVLV